MIIRTTLTVLLLGIFATPAFSNSTIWASPFLFHPINQDEQLTIRDHIPNSGAVDVTTANLTPNDPWIHLPVTISTDLRIDAIRVCYQVNGSASFIHQVRLFELTDPSASSVFADFVTSLTSSTPICTAFSANASTPTGAVSVALRLHFASTSDVITIGGIGLDVSPNVTAVQTSQETTHLVGQSMPNPARGTADISYVVPRSGRVNVAIYDAAGHRVRMLVDGDQEAGARRVSWDGRDDQGRLLAPGIFFYEVRVAGETTGIRKMTLLR